MCDWVEFERLITEHRRAQLDIKLGSIAETAEYLCSFVPLETFLKESFVTDINMKTLWNYESYYFEKTIFDYQYKTANISVAKHFRYDRHLMHDHEFFQMNYVFCGNGQICVGDNEIPINNGDFLLISPKTLHRIEAFNDDCVIIKIYIRKSTFEKTFFEWLGENNLLSEFFRRALYGGDTIKYIMFHTQGDEYVGNLALTLYAEMMTHREFYSIIGEVKITELFCRLVRDHMDGTLLSYEDGGSTNIGAIIKYIQTNYQTATLDETARVAGYSKNYLCRLISKATGRTFTEILNGVKIDAAARMLLSTDLGAAEIGLRSGFNSNEHFHRTFKRIKGATPQEWRSGTGKNEKNRGNV